MPAKSSNLGQFWQELKRRKVVRVIAMYAGAAYIIIELVSNITDPLRLPGCIETLVMLLLAIGFPITVILSWIFDVTPGGIKKTEPVAVAIEKKNSANLVKRKLRVSDLIIAVFVVVVVIYVIPPKDNIWEFEFIVDEPTGILIPLTTPLISNHRMSFSDWKGITNLVCQNWETLVIGNPTIVKDPGDILIQSPG